MKLVVPQNREYTDQLKSC